jgi:serine protease Do
MGFPLGIRGDPAATLGILSRHYTDALRGQVLDTDVLANPGNSGGPLLDRAGNVIGVVYALRTDSDGEERGLTLVLAAEEVLAILDDLKAGARVN